MAKTVQTVKVLAYKNGEGRLRPGEIICGSSVTGVGFFIMTERKILMNENTAFCTEHVALFPIWYMYFQKLV